MRYNLLIPRPYQFGPSLANASFWQCKNHIGGNYEISQFAPPVRDADSAVEPHGHTRWHLGTAGTTTAGPASSRAKRSSRGATDSDFHGQAGSIEGQRGVKK